MTSPGFRHMPNCTASATYTFLRGASHPAELVEQAAALGYTALALTDECSVAGIVRAHVAARRHAIQLIIGSEFSWRMACSLCCWLPTVKTMRRSVG